MNDKIRTALILIWILSFYMLYYYFEIKKYLGIAHDYLPAFF